jgi:CheY-like chemotaxis protein
MRVLVIDDNPVQADGLCLWLADRGVEADWTPCLQGALGRLKLRRYDAAVVDLVVPCCTTRELVAGLLAAPHAPPLVAFTGLAPGDPALRALPPGTPVVFKPADPADVLAAVAGVVEAAAAAGGV